MNRRRFVLSALGGAGALVVGWGLLPPRSRQGDRHSLPVSADEVGLNGWIKIQGDGTVVLAMHRAEMGQGVHTGLAMLVAEELDVLPERIRLMQAAPEAIYGNVATFVASLPVHPRDAETGRETMPVRVGRWMVRKVARELGINVTGGSTTLADAWDVLRLAAATARAQLLGAASLQWKLPVAELRIVDGVIEHASGPRAHFGELARQAAALSVSEVPLKDPSQWRLIGRTVLRTDVPPKVDGRAVFGLDVRLHGLVFAVVRHAPMLGGSPGRVDADAVLRLPGVLRVVRLRPQGGAAAAVAVVARTTWHARRAAAAMDIEWRPPPHDPEGERTDTRRIDADLAAQAARAHRDGGGFAFHRRGDVAAAEVAAARTVEATYHAPYLLHATMEPLNCTAQVREGEVTVWTSTQVPGLAREAAAAVAGVPVDRVTVHATLIGGGFGRRLDVDVVGQAVRIAQETGGLPVQLVWPREEDFTHDFYRPAAVAVLRAGLDAQGRPQVLRCTSAGDAIQPRWLARNLPALAGPVDLPDKSTMEGLYDLPYDVPHQRMAHVATRHEVPIGFWRAVGHSHNAFFSESFIDELAHEAKQDPVAFRLALLAGRPAHAAVLRLVAEKAGWGRPLPAGQARGVALHESFGSIVAQVAEVSLDGGGPRVHRVVCAVDCGVVVNPGIVAQQMESGVIFGLSAALHGRVDIEGGMVKQQNFTDVPLITLAQAPRVETHLVPSERPPTGVGEPGLPPVAPAVANALFALTGERRRRLPLVS